MNRRLFCCLALCLTACQTPAPAPAPSSEPVAATVALPAPPADRTVLTVDPDASDVQIYVFRGGAAARMGHNHVLTVRKLRGWVDAADTGGSFALSFALADLAVDPPALLAAQGPAFNDRPRGDDDRAGTLRNLLRSTDAERWPEVQLLSTSVIGEGPLRVAEVAIRLHGITRTETVALSVVREGTQIAASGQFAIRQSDYGITPFSVMGGLLAVQDPLLIRFQVVAR